MFYRSYRLAAFALLWLITVHQVSDWERPVYAANWPPYAIVKNDNALVIRWKTSEPSQDTLVLYDEQGKRELRAFGEEADLKHHLAPLEGLVPGALLRYRIQGTKNIGMEGRVRVPRQEAECAFFVVSDTQALSIPGTLEMELSRQRLLVETIDKDPFPADFLVHTGDLVESGAVVEYDAFFSLIAPLSSKMPLFAVKGNHDDRTEVFVDAFAFPVDGRPYGTDWHHFKTANALFAFLNLNFNSLAQVSATVQWLNAVLEENKERRWKFIFTHQPIYSNVERDSNTPFRSLFEPLLIKYGVDAVFSGHHHAYQRIVRNGIMYVISGGGGAASYSPVMSKRFEGTVKTEEKTIHYLRGRIQNDRFLLEVRGVGEERQEGRVKRRDFEMDRFELTKP
jgi:predicted phosphodiesterase